MASRGLDLRKQGERRTKASRPGIADAFRGPFDSLESGAPGEVRVVGDQMTAIHQLYTTSPSMQAARSILMGQLLSSGIVLRRSGKDVPLTEGFAKHLESVWMPFARDVIDSFIQYGFAAVSIEEEDPPPFTAFQNGGKGVGDAIDVEKRSKRQRLGSTAPARAESETAKDLLRSQTNLIPCVCEMGTYEVSWLMGGRRGYKRRYRVATLGNARALQVDPDVGLFFKSEPDSYGNINSSVATCFEQAAFVAALQELALNAEVVRARTQLITQSAPKIGTASAQLDAANMFFDSESRAIHERDKANENNEQASSLAMMVRLCESLNKSQTHAPSGGGAGPSAGPLSHVPPEIPPRLFTIPERQQVVPNLRAPESRTDLENLMRIVNDQICAALGVPASVVFEGKFSSNSMSQLQLLNTTVSAMAINVNNVLSACYHAAFGEASGRTDQDELMLMTAPLSAASEVQGLYEKGVIDYETAVPAALHSLGCSANEITEALKRRRTQSDTQGVSDAATAESDNAIKAAQAEHTRAGIPLIVAQTEKVKADTKLSTANAYKAKKDADRPTPTPVAGAAGGVAAGASSGGGASGR